jgi:hypothetical protein
MRRDWLALIIAAFLVGCGDQSPSTMPALQAGEALNARRAVAKNYIAQLSGGEEVPANDSRSRGNAEFQLSPDGSELSYRLIVANLQDLHMAHIHSGTAGANGPIVVWLYPSAPPPEPIPGRTSGVLAEGVITEANRCLRKRPHRTVRRGGSPGSDQGGRVEVLSSDRLLVASHQCGRVSGQGE